MNSVNSPSCDSTFISPPCRRTMSLEIESPSPVPSLVALVVKNGSKILAFTSSGMPVPLSRTRTSTRSPSRRVLSHRVGW